MNDLPETTTSHTYILDQNEKIAGYRELSRSEVEAALALLDQRTKDREAREVEGTHCD